MAAPAKCVFCHIPIEHIKSQSYQAHIIECCEFDRKNLEECPYGQACDSNIESHFTRYNHSFLNRQNYILNSPSKPKRRRNPSKTPTKSPRASKTPTKSPRASKTPTKSPRASKTPTKSPRTFKTPTKSSRTPPFSTQTESQRPSTSDQDLPSNYPDPGQSLPATQRLSSTRKSLFNSVPYEDAETALEEDNGLPGNEEEMECSPEYQEDPVPGISIKVEDEEENFPAPDENHNPKTGDRPKEKIQKAITDFFQSNNPEPPKAVPTKSGAASKSVRFLSKRSGPRSKHSEDSTSHSSGSSSSLAPDNRCQDSPTGRNCPFYKKIENTAIAVDAFSYGSIPGIKFYFLTHFHSDHYCGLTKNFPHLVYCSQVTADLVELKMKLPKSKIRVITLNESFVIDNITVTPLDANHCPGSVMLLLEFLDGRRYLHTGDFRAKPQMATIGLVDFLYLDTTYCDPVYTFPPQEKVLIQVENLVWEALQSNLRTLFLCGSYLIGKEKLFLAVAEALESKIWANAEKQKVLRSQGNHFITDRLVDNARDATVHVVFMGQLNYKYLQQHMKDFSDQYDQLVAFRPTGWEFSSASDPGSIKTQRWGKVLLYGIPYSEHSSFEELKNFVQSVRPRKIISTVPSGYDKKNSILRSWLRK